MLLKDLVRILPVYTMVHVHDEGTFAYQGNPHQFVSGIYKSLGDMPVVIASPILPYHMEVTVKEEPV